MHTYEQTTINGFQVAVFTGFDGTQLFITDADGVQVYAHRVSGDAIVRARAVISSMTESRAIETASMQDEDTETAFRQLYAEALKLDKATGKRTTKALEKAIDEIDLNPSITFDGKLLSFTSRDSRKKRTVTQFGCVQGFCDCENQISYHKTLFAILKRRDEIRKYRAVETVAAASINNFKPETETLSCGCKLTVNEGFNYYTKQCAPHQAEYDAGSKLNDADCEYEYLWDKYVDSMAA